MPSIRRGGPSVVGARWRWLAWAWALAGVLGCGLRAAAAAAAPAAIASGGRTWRGVDGAWMRARDGCGVVWVGDRFGCGGDAKE